MAPVGMGVGHTSEAVEGFGEKIVGNPDSIGESTSRSPDSPGHNIWT